MNRYSAKLLFQFRVGEGEAGGRMRTCEERIVHYPARTDKEALAKAKRSGRKEEYKYKNQHDVPVCFEFIGVLDLVRMVDDDPAIVWYDIKRRLLPMERRAQIIPDDPALLKRA